jgi:phage FluMu gp28-like protein
VKWLPYQWKYLEDPARLRVVAKSRAVGFSEASAGEGAMRMLGIEMSRYRRPRIGAPPASQNLLSASWPQSKAFLARLRPHLYYWLALFPRLAKVTTDTRTEIVIDHRANEEIAALALSTNPRSARGWRGDVRLDEWAFVPNQRALWKAVFALASVTPKHPNGFRITAVSTPFGDTDHFYEIVHDSSGAWSLHKVDVHTARRDGFPMTDAQLAEYRLQAGDADTWEQEYELSFLSSSQRFIDSDTYDGCIWYADTDSLPPGKRHLAEPLALPEHMRTKFGGVDIGRKRHFTVLCTLETDRDKRTLWNTANEAVKGMSFEDQESWLFGDTQDYRRIAVDSTGLGMATAERWVSRRGEHAIEPVTFTNPMKEELATGLRLAMQRRLVRPNADSVELRKAVLSMRRKITPSKNFVYDTDETAEGGHGDHAWALALAVRAAGGAICDVPSPEVYTPDEGQSVYGVKQGGWRT